MALNEAFQQMINTAEASVKEEWVATITQLLMGIDCCLSSDSSSLNEASATQSLIRLTNNLIQVSSVLTRSFSVLRVIGLEDVL